MGTGNPRKRNDSVLLLTVETRADISIEGSVLRFGVARAVNAVGRWATKRRGC